jgi:hypothetical protein
MPEEDHRVWVPTDRPGELLTQSVPIHGVEVMSVVNSDRKWSDVHTDYVVAFVDGAHPVEAVWQLGSRSYTPTNGGFFLFAPNSVHRTLAVSAKSSFSVGSAPLERHHSGVNSDT